jgi:histidinol-phosphate aminotransferase
MSLEDIIRPELAPLKPYAPGLRVSQVRERCGKDLICKLSSNEAPLGPFPAAVKAMEAVLPRLNRYPDGGAAALREKLANLLDVDLDQIAVGNGSNELLRLIGQAVLRPGDEVVFGWPSFIVYPMVTALFGAKEVRVDLTENAANDLEAMADAITDATRLVFLCNPNNPTGAIYDKAAFERFLDRVPDHVLVVADEAYFEYACDDPEYPDALRYFDGTRPLAVCRTFSKMYALAGLRVGYTIAPAALVDAIAKVREPFNVSTVAQVAAYFSLDDDAEVARRRAENQEQKTYLYSCFDRLGIDYVPSHTNFVYVRTKRPVEVFQALLDEGIIARDFGSAPALRVGVGSAEESRLTAEAFEKVVRRLGPL